MSTTASPSVYEEKLSPKLDSKLEKEKHNVSLADCSYEEGSKTDAVLDEIAAKVNALEIRKENEESNTSHVKCMDTVRKQGETINALVYQLQNMFDEYHEMSSEREYYEELNEALLRCLEITEGKLQLQDESEEEDTESVDVKNPVKTSTSQKDTDAEEIVNKEVVMDTYNKASASTATQDDPCSSRERIEEEINVKKEREVKGKKITNNELKRLNRILLREILELRHQIEVMKENIRDYLISEDGSRSDYDTATDDDHICEQCKPPAPQEVASEDYENDDNETLKIDDETDSD